MKIVFGMPHWLLLFFNRQACQQQAFLHPKAARPGACNLHPLLYGHPLPVRSSFLQALVSH